ncbi:arrestin domain-containing protein 3-like [Pseudochaenichthys georgianus]|uniref:arrestin domain-containing protein 3-like n=1 Tax=Pseudochaenichthys georgianus TaxID=52239 RepID=UPI00146B4F3F|nr:arrestin domain-containing protein 3-like [Pseudochaenichthys georgianus]
MPSIKSLTLTCDALNEQGTFSEGDTISGKVTLALLKQITVDSFFIKATGDANVHWTTKSGDKTHSHSAHTRYFKLKQFLFPEASKDTVLPQGIHVYKFSLKIPQGSVPSSFKGPHGKIVYKLEAKLSRSWRMDQTVEQKILFVSRCYPNLHSLMLPQIGATKKEMGLFSKGQADMEVTIDRMAYAPGETITVLAKINNSSSSEMTPKFRLGKKVIYRARGSTKCEECTIIKVVENRIQAHTELEVRCRMKIPLDQTATIQNCDILSVEYHLKVYLDISFAFDPEVLFPLVVVPLGFAPVPQPGMAAGPYPAGAVGGPSNSDFPPPAVSRRPYPVSPSSGRSGNPGAPMYSAPPPPVYPGNPMVFPCPPSVYPAQPAHVSGGYNNQVPEIPFPYGTPFSSSVIHPPPSAPTFQTPPAAPAIHLSPSLPVIHPPPSLAAFNLPPSYSPFNVSPTAPSYNLGPSAPMMNTDFLGQSDEAPPAYALLFPSTTTDKSVAK